MCSVIMGMLSEKYNQPGSLLRNSCSIITKSLQNTMYLSQGRPEGFSIVKTWLTKGKPFGSVS